MTNVRRDPDDDRYAYSRRALARLVLSYELSELADHAASGVSTGSDEWAHAGETVGEALDLVQRAQEVLARAVVYERAKGTSWEAIAEQLDIKRQSAHERYRAVEEEWKQALHQPFHPSRPGAKVRNLRLHTAAYTPTETGRTLDAWARDRGEGDYAVTGGLPTLSLVEELNQVLDGLSHLYRDMYADPDPVARARLLERKAALLDRIAVEDGRPEAAEQAEEARARAAELRREAADDTGEVE